MVTVPPRAAPGSAPMPSSFAGAFAYEQSDIPPGITLEQYRRTRRTKRRPSAIRRLTQRLHKRATRSEARP